MDEIRPAMEASAGARSGPFATNPRMPTDGGLPSLGLIMQLGAAVLFCVALMFVIILLTPIVSGGMRGIFLLLTFLSLVRSVVHFGAGSRLADSGVDGRARTRTYIIVAAVQTIATLVLVAFGMPGFEIGMLVYLALLLMAWPLALLWVVSRPEVVELHARAATGDIEIRSRNRGVEGAGALMTAMGVIGLILGLLFTYMLFQGSPLRAGFAGILIITLALTLLVRSGFHVAAGVASLKGVGPMDFNQRIRRYVSASIASIILLAVLAFVAMASAGTPMLLLQFVVLGGLLGAWPFVLNQYGQRVGGVVFFAEDNDDGYGPAPDSGLTAIGYLLLGSGSLGLAATVGDLVSGGMAFGALSGADIGLGAQDEWYIALPVSLLTLWAGVELIRMTERFKVAALVYAVVAGGIAVWDFIAGMSEMGGQFALLGPGAVFGLTTIAGVAAALVLPILTVILAYRHRDEVLSLREIFS